MKKKIVLLALIPLLAACGDFASSTGSLSGSASSKSSSSDEISSSSLISSPSSSSAEALPTIKVTYRYANGTPLSEVAKTFAYGESYEFRSPEFPFLSPDIPVISGVVDQKSRDFTVIYSYDQTKSGNLEKDTAVSSFYLDSKQGLSLTAIISGATSDLEPLLSGENFTLGNGYFSFNQDAGGVKQRAEFYGSKHRDSQNPTGSVVSDEHHEHYLSITILPSEIIYYLDGVKTFSFDASTSADAVWKEDYSQETAKPTLADFLRLFFKELPQGFTLKASDPLCPTDYLLHDLVFKQAQTAEEVASDFAHYVSSTFHFVDETGASIHEPYVYFTEKGARFAMISPEIEDLEPSDSKMYVKAEENKTYTIVYHFPGEERLSQESVFDRSGLYGWAESALQRPIASFEGDFAVQVKYRNQGAMSLDASAKTGDVCWRTALSVLSDSANPSSRWVERLDWYGWVDQGLGDNASYGVCYLYNFDKDLFPVFHDCQIVSTYRRSGTSLSITSIIKPNDVAYQNRTYTYISTLQNVRAPKLSLSFAAEDAKITFQSIRY